MDNTGFSPSSPTSTKPAGTNSFPNYVGAGLKAVLQAQTKPPPPLSSPAETASPAPAASEVTAVMGPGPSAPPKESRKGGGKNFVLVVFLILLLGGLVAGFGRIRSFISSAEGSCLPENLAEANLTPSSVEIVFQTGKACQMEVAYGISREALLLQVPEATASLNHRIRLTPLLSSTTYYYQVVAQGKKTGTVRSFLTKAVVLPSPSPEPTEILLEASPSPATTEGTPKATYTLNDFQAQFGSDNPVFDIDKNGIVNMADWLIYQKQP